MKVLIIMITAFLFTGCYSQKQLIVNGMICPEGHSEEQIKADFSACRYYNIDDAAKASIVPSDCKECLSKKGYKVE